MRVYPSVKTPGVYSNETMDIPNIINVVEDSELDKMLVFNISYHLLDESNDRFTLEVSKEYVPEFNRTVTGYRLFLDGTVVCIFCLVGDEVKFLFVSEMFNEVPKSFEEDLLKIGNKYLN